jgi:hypothetical protein
MQLKREKTSHSINITPKQRYIYISPLSMEKITKTRQSSLGLGGVAGVGT